MNAKSGEIGVCLEHRFYEYSGHTYTKLAFSYEYWRDYLSHFDGVAVIARVQQIPSVEPGMVRVDGPGVTVEPIPYYVGPREFVSTIPALMSRMVMLAKKYDRFLLRTGNVANLLWLLLIIKRKPYLREYPGNVWEGVVGFAGENLAIKSLAWFLHYFARIQGRFSVANSFVSRYCEGLYGSKRPGYVFSSFALDEVSTLKESFDIAEVGVRIISVGRLEGEKGHASLIDAVGKLQSRCRVVLEFVGDGSKLNQLRERAKMAGVEAVFLGAITDRGRLFEALSQADIFVIPSLTEGMPRALLEAMAVGLPCVGSRVGGIPEVLDEKFLYSPGDSFELACLIERLVADPDLRRQQGHRNRSLVRHRYSRQEMRAQKSAFWSCINE